MLDKFVSFFVGFVFVSVLFSVGCSAQQTEEQALESLRQLTKDGKLPPESVVANLESRFAGKRTGALAKLLRGRLRYETGDFAGAAAILNSNDFQQKTTVADYALWLRGKALQQAGNHSEAMKVLSDLVRDYPDSVRAREAKLALAISAIAAGRAVEAPPFLIELTERNDADALLFTAKAYEAQTAQNEAIQYYRRTYFFAAGSAVAKEAETKLTSLGQPLTAQNADEQLARADRFLLQKNYKDASAAYSELSLQFPGSIKGPIALRFFTAALNAGIQPSRGDLFAAIAPENLEQAYRELVLGYARAKMWPQTRSTADEMRAKFPNGKFVAKTFIDAGLAARDARNRTDEGYFLNTAVVAYPNAVEVAQAQFESAWFQHEGKNFAQSSQMLIDHLARYADKDTTNRGKAGYWAARDSERAGKTDDACNLYESVIYRYAANWYGYQAQQRLASMKSQGKCGRVIQLPTSHSPLANAVANLRTVTVAPETSGPDELSRAKKSDELSTIGLFDWAIDELVEAKKTANNSPKINLALAKHYRLKGDNVNALLALAKSYPDYSQMFPEEMGREEWDIFYPLSNWDQISAWAKNRNLDQYQVAGLIRQESVFNPRAKSPAKAYGLMQLILPTAQSVARKYGSTASISIESLFLPALNIELGTAYMRDQLDKFGRIEYMAVAYNAGPGRVPQWRSTLPMEIDEFVEEIPFKETKAYVQGVIRNSAQYRRLYDENGSFKPNVGTRPLRGEIDSKSREQFIAEFPEIVVIDAAESE